MDLRKLEFFEAVARVKNFTKAAEELRVSQPSITMAIQSLEQSLGVRLLIRNQREVLLTTEGEILYQKAVHILKDVNNAMQQMMDLGQAANAIISIGITPIIGADIYPIMLKGFKKVYPHVKFHTVEIGTHGVLEELIKGNIEIGYIVFPENLDKRFKTVEVVHGEVNVLIHKDNPLSKYEKIPLNELVSQTHIQLPNHSFLRREMDKLYAEHGIIPQSIIEPTQMITNFELVAIGLGISFLLNPNMSMVKENNLLITRPLENALEYRAGFVWNSDGYLSDISKKLMEYIVENH